METPVFTPALLNLAKQGHMQAQTTLGKVYAEGSGVAQNLSQALHWFSQAAAQGDPQAVYWMQVLQRNVQCPWCDD